MPHVDFLLNVEYLVYALPVLFILVLSGFGLTTLILSAEKLHLLLYVCPWVGFCYVTFCSWNFYFYGFKGTDSYALYILSFSILLIPFAVRKLRKSKLALKQILDLNVAVGYLLVLVTFIVISLPLILTGSSATTMVMGNNDMAEYGIESRALKEFVRHTDIGFASDGQLQSLMDQNYFGQSVFTAYCASVLKLMPHNLLTICINIFYSLLILVFFLMGKDIFNIKLEWLIVICLFFCINSVTNFIVFNGYLPQIIAMGLMMLLFYLVFQCSPSLNDSWQCLGMFPLFFLFTWGIFITYPHMLVLIFSLMMLYAIVYSICYKYRLTEAVITFTGPMVLSIIGVWSLSPFRMYSFLSILTNTATSSAGWFIPYLWPSELLGITGGVFFGVRIPWYISLTISMAILISVCFFYFKLSWKDKKFAIPFLFVILAIGAGSIILAFAETAKSGFGGYKSFKLISFFLPLMVLCYFAVIANGFSRCNKTERIVFIVAFVPMVCVILLSSIILNKYVYNHGKRVPSFYEELSIIDKDPSVSSINILGDSFWEPMWESYFLINKNLFFESPSYYPSTPLNGEYDLVSKVNMAGEHLLVF